MLQADISKMSDSELDAAFAKAFDAKNTREYIPLNSEILDRLQSVGSFITGWFGAKRFPLFDARGNFQQVEAVREAVKTSAGNVAGNISFGVKGAIALIVFVGVIILVLKFKK